MQQHFGVEAHGEPSSKPLEPQNMRAKMQQHKKVQGADNKDNSKFELKKEWSRLPCSTQKK